jgi:hypothetical protein
MQRLEIVSKTSGTGVTVNLSMTGHPINTVRKSMLLKSQLVKSLGNPNDPERANIK